MADCCGKTGSKAAPTPHPTEGSLVSMETEPGNNNPLAPCGSFEWSGAFSLCLQGKDRPKQLSLYPI